MQQIEQLESASLLVNSNRNICVQESTRISRQLLDHYAQITDPSLFNGKTGIILFQAYYAKLFADDRVKEQLGNLIDCVLNDLSEQPLHFSFVNGVSGIHWALQHVNKLYEYEFFEEGLLEELSPLIEKFTLAKLREGNYDLFYGALGGYLSLLESKTTTPALHAEICEQLIGISTYARNKKYWWIDTLNRKNGNVVNLGMAHGLPSIWYFLELLYQNTREERIKEVLYSSISAIDELSLKDSYSLFPVEIHVDDNFNETDPFNRRSSKLSWCYGDLCIAHGLLRAGRLLNDQQIKDHGLMIAKETLKRNTMEQAGLFDPCLCHGTSSCLHFYNRFYQLTGLPDFAGAANDWFQKGLGFRSEQGYQLLEVEDNDIVIYPYSLLDGMTGIGLAYLSSVSETPLDWDKMLLLS